VTVRAAPIDAEQRRHLEDERDFLLRSIEDLDSERAAGDLADADYEALRDDYTARAALVLRTLANAPDPSEAPSGDDTGAVPPNALERPDEATDAGRPRRRRRLLLWGALAAFAIAAVVLVVAEVTVRLPGQTSSGSITLSRTQQLERTLAQAETLENEGKLSQALVLYHQVLAQDPTQEQALTESGWLEYEAGVAARNSTLLSRGQENELAAEHADPSAYAPHLYLGSMLLVENQSSSAADEFSRFLAASPPVTVEQTAWPYVVRAFTQAGRPVPPVPAGVKG
jgi:tetratricopeptide (TPR) repeat protein